MRSACFTFFFLLVAPTVAFVTPSRNSCRAKPLSAQQRSRSDFLGDITAAVVGTTVASFSSLVVAPTKASADETLPSGVSIKIVKSGNGPLPDVGELAAIRFSSSFGEIVLDNVFDTPEPYYTRVGSGGLIKGVEEVLPKMRMGDRWVITVPGNLAFGPKGRPASAGKPRIPSNAVIVFDVEMVGLPGKEPELIELIGDV